MKRSTKRLVSFLICLVMVIAMLPAAVFAAEPMTVYCQAPESWTDCYIHYWGDDSTSWPGVAMSQDAEGIWYFELPAGANNLLFHNNSGVQTADLDRPKDENVQYVPEKLYWTVYGKVPVEVDYYVAGQAGLCGVEWDPGAAANKMTKNADGTYSITYTSVAAGIYELKVCTGTWSTCWGKPGSSDNYAVTVDSNDSVVVISFDPATELVSSEVNPVPVTEKTLVGEGTAIFETDLDAWNSEAVSFVPVADGTVTVEIVACDPGFYLDVYEDEIWLEEHFDSVPKIIDIPVTADVTYEFLFSSAEVTSPTIYDMKAGSVTYKITADVAAKDPNPDDGENPDPILGDSELNPQPITAFFGKYIAAGQTMWFSYDNYQNMIQNGAYSQMLYISGGASYSVTYRGIDVPVDEAGFVVYEMMDMTHQGEYVFSVTNNSAYEAYFTMEVKDRPAYVVYETQLVLGDNTVVTDPGFTNTLYEFAPAEAGIYTFTVDAGVIGEWGIIFNPRDNTPVKTNQLQWTCTSQGQSILIGVAQTEEAVLNVAKTGDYVAEPEIPVTVYENTYGFDYQLPENPELVEIDVLDDRKDVAVLKDGFYRYGSEYGCLMVADLSEFPVNLADAYINGQLRAYVTDANGKPIKRFDYNEAMYEYLDAGLVPVTEELARMLTQVGDHHGWWLANGFVFEGEAPEDASTAWMAACSYIKGSELEAEVDNTVPGGSNQGGGNQNGENDNPKTADLSMAWAMTAMVLASAALVLLKKKETFFLN